MPESHTAQNRFAGSPRIKRPVPKGGVQHVLERHVIAMPGCWCGREVGHDWPGKEQGAPHPREETQVVAMSTEDIPTLVRGDIPDFKRDTQALLMHIVNDLHVRWRVIDGGHILLYPPDGVSRPFKVAKHRSVKENERILRAQFIERYIDKRPEPEEEPVEETMETQPEPDVDDERDHAETEPGQPGYDTTWADKHPESEVSKNSEVVMRECVALLSTALGLDTSLEDEALQALEEVDRLSGQLEVTKRRLTRVADQFVAEQRETARLKAENARLAGLLDETVTERDKYKSRLSALRDALSGD